MKTRFFFIVINFIITITVSAQWTWRNPLPQGHNLWAAWFINSNTGYAVGNEGTVIKTTDGGETWNAQYVSSPDDLSSVWFVNENIGYVAGKNGQINKTTDGGNSWFSGTKGFIPRRFNR